MLRRSAKPSKPIPVHPSIRELPQRYPALDALDLAALVHVAAAADTPIDRRTSLAFSTPEGRLNDKALRAGSAPSILRIEQNQAHLGAANPGSWTSEWTMHLDIAGAEATVLYGEALLWGKKALNQPTRDRFVLRLEAILRDGLTVDADEDDERLAAALVWDDVATAPDGNGTEDTYVEVPDWFVHDAAIDLPAGSGARVQDSPALSLLVGRRETAGSDALTIHLDGGRTGQRSALVLEGDRLRLDAPDWSGRTEAFRQQTLRAALGALADIAVALHPPHPELAAALGQWQARVVQRYQGSRDEVVVPAVALGTAGPRLPLSPGVPVPVGLAVRGAGGEPVDTDLLERLVPVATRWATLRLTRWRWAVSSDDPNRRELDYYTGPYRAVHGADPSPWIDYGDAVNGSPTGTIDLAPSPRRAAWRAGWSSADGQWLVTAQTLTKQGTGLGYGGEYVAFLQALTWLVREAAPTAHVEHLWLTP